MGNGNAEEPTEPVGIEESEGDIPAVADGVTVGVALSRGGVMLAVSEGVGIENDDGTKAEDGRGSEVGMVPVGTTPDEGRTPEGTTPDGTLVGMMPDGSLLGTMIVPEAVGRRGSIPEDKLDSIVGSAGWGTSETAEDRMLDRSGMGEDTTGGRRPLKVGEAVGAVGAVGPRVDGTTPGRSDTTDDRRGGRSSRPVLVGAVSEVGIAPELTMETVGVGAGDSPVPKAVVMPITMPEEGSGSRGRGALSEDTAALVGRTGSLGRSPVVPTSGASVGEG